MRVAFAGTPPFAARALQALAAAGHHIPLVLTQPDRPAGRGLKLVPSAVSEAAATLGLAIAKPPSLRDEASREPLRAARPDVLVVAAYGLILPQAVLDIPARGCINIHASLLPRWRGAAPIQRALLAGDAESGVCIMKMDAGLDTGPVLLSSPLTLGPRETAGTLTERLAELGARCIVQVLGDLEGFPEVPQQGVATYAAKLAKSEARIDWSRSAEEIDRQVRAFDPAPGAQTGFLGESIKVREAFALPGRGDAGVVLESSGEGLVVGCGGGGLLRVTAVQRPGGRRIGVADFLRGHPITPGTRAESPMAPPAVERETSKPLIP